MRIISILPAILFCFGLLSCKKDKTICNERRVTKSEISGNWNHHYSSWEEYDFTFPTRYNIRFTQEDSFYLKLTKYSDYFTPACYYGEWDEYIAGTVYLENTKLILSGVHTASDFKSAADTCYDTGIYRDTFTTYFCNDTLVLEWENQMLEGISSNKNSWKYIKLGKE